MTNSKNIKSLGKYPDKTIIWKDTCAPMFIAAWFTTNKTRKQPKRPPREEWVKKMWSIHTVECFSVRKRAKIHLQQHRYNQRLSLLSKSERERQTPHNITYMRNLKCSTNELIYETETDPQRKGLWVPRGEGWGRGGVWVSGCKPLHEGWMDKAPPCSTGSDVQHPVTGLPRQRSRLRFYLQRGAGAGGVSTGSRLGS